MGSAVCVKGISGVNAAWGWSCEFELKKSGGAGAKCRKES
jgi:hypothetical protein